MLTLVFIVLMLAVFGNLIVLAIRGAWGLIKVLFSLVFLPFILIGMVLKGLVVLALPVLIIIGAIVLFSELIVPKIG